MIVQPLISCLCITRNKPDELMRAVKCFADQTYLNKEMVVVYESDDAETGAFLKGLQMEDIRSFEIKRSQKNRLGHLRNIALEQARGEFVCQWDDDDWYHIGRLEYQFEALTDEGKNGCLMQKWLVFDGHSGDAYLSNERLWEGSILCRKSLLKEIGYRNLAKGEDTEVVDALFKLEELTLLSDVPNLYVYHYNGKNTWDYKHWQFIFKSSFKLSKTFSDVLRDILAGQYSNTEGSYLIDELLNNPIFEAY